MLTFSLWSFSVGPEDLDRHPERRMKAAFAAYEEANMPRLKMENPNMRLSQLKQQLKKEWMKAPENPLNQRFSNYNTKWTHLPAPPHCSIWKLSSDAHWRPTVENSIISFKIECCWWKRHTGACARGLRFSDRCQEENPFQLSQSQLIFMSLHLASKEALKHLINLISWFFFGWQPGVLRLTY